MSASPTEEERAQVLNAYKAKVREHREMESRCVFPLFLLVCGELSRRDPSPTEAQENGSFGSFLSRESILQMRTQICACMYVCIVCVCAE